MGMVYQNPLLGLRMDYSSAANVAEKIIAAGNRNVAFMDGRTVELLEAVEILTSRRAEPPRNFSGGMQQRVQISKALANNPGLLLLDEVTTGLDLSVQAKVLDLIRKIRSRYNISIILVSHDIGTVLAMVKNIACVNETLHYHPGADVSEEWLGEKYACPIELIGHGDLPHRVLKKHEHE